MSDLSDREPPADHAIAVGPESLHVIDAVDALLRGHAAEARAALTEGAEAVGWPAIGHRVDVAGRALALDACTEFGDDRGPFRLVAEVNAWTDQDTIDLVDVPEVLDRWCASPLGAGEDTPSHQMWTALALLAWLVERSGYPAEVVA